jgi:hypothetical protein
MMKEEDVSASKAEVPEASPEANADATKETKTPPSSPRRGMYLALGIMAVIAATLCIVLPLTLVDRSSNSSSSTVSTANVASSDSFSSGHSNTNDYTDPSTTAAATTTTSATVGVISSTKVMFPASDAETKEGFLPLYGPGVTQGYSSPEELISALKLALGNQATHIVQRKQEEAAMYFGKETEMMPPVAMAESGAVAEGDMAVTSSGATSANPPSEEGVTDFATNNQEEDVDEADM